MFAGGLKDGIEHLSNLLGSAFPSEFLNLRFDRVFLSLSSFVEAKHLAGRQDSPRHASIGASAPKKRSIRAPTPRNLDSDFAFWPSLVLRSTNKGNAPYAWHSALADRHPDPYYHSALAVRRTALARTRPRPQDRAGLVLEASGRKQDALPCHVRNLVSLPARPALANAVTNRNLPLRIYRGLQTWLSRSPHLIAACSTRYFEVRPTLAGFLLRDLLTLFARL